MHPHRSRSRRAVTLLAVSMSLLASACSGSQSATSGVQDTATAVPLTGCDQVACSGSLGGAQYEIKLPKTWNGTLLIYSHGYRYAQPAPPNFEPVTTSAQSSPDATTAKTLLDQGFALAGSSYASNGWAVEDGVKAAEDLHTFFVDKIAAPKRTLVWGDSLGGLITQTIAEKHPDWVDGAAPFCGALAGVVPNMDLALDVTYAVKTLVYPQMKLTGYTSYQEAVTTWTTAVKKLIAAAQDTAGGGTAKVLYIAALVDAPSQTETFDGSSIQSKVKATVEALATALGYGTFARYDLEQRFGGNPSGNVGVDYAARISPTEKSLIETVGAGAVARLDREMASGRRVAADATARTKAQKTGGDPQGTVQKPTITLHTAADPLVIVQNESFFKSRYDAAVSGGKATRDLVQLYTVAPETYPEDPGAPYGAGHCNFTSQSRVAVIDLLTDWVQRGTYPGTAAIARAMGTESGFVADFQPGPWPRPETPATP